MKPTIVIITGLSGSGKTVALRALEDEGFFCVDNLPVNLIESFASIVSANDNNTKIGIGIDVREKEFLPAIDSVLSVLKGKYKVEIIFLEAEKDTIIRRFKETRRPHPLVSGNISIEDAIDSEKTMLSLLREQAEKVIDTSSNTPHQLRHLVSSLFKVNKSDNLMTLTLMSFGYKFGISQNLDLLFDVRFIPNPYFIPELKDLNGTDTAVQDFIFEKPSTKEFMDRTAALLNFLIPLYIAEGKSYLTVGFGCTGGKHRSPAIVEGIATLISANAVDVNVIHRDIQL